MKATRAHVHYLKSGDASYDTGKEFTYDVPDTFIEGETGMDALETIYRQFNRVDGSEYISTMRLKIRSLCVAELDGKVYVCAGHGWTEITPAEGRWLIEKVTGRDFCKDIATTKKLMAYLPK
jgi:hypothetical protein